MLESEIESAVCKYAKERGLLVYKFTSPNRRSVPDRLFLHPHGPWCFFIEFKSTTGRTTNNQVREIERLFNHGHNVYVCNDVELGKRLIDAEITNTAARVSAKSDRLQSAS